MPYPGDRWDLPTKDEFADYLERYAKEFDLPVRTGVRVNRLARNGQRFVATADDRHFEADNVVVAMSSWQQPRVPGFASELDPGIVQLPAAEYRNPGQLQTVKPSWSGPAIREQRSPSNCPEPIGCGCRESPSGSSRSGPRAPWHEC